MNAIEKRRDDALNAIGQELADRHLSGRLDFDAFKSLFLRGLEAAGDDTDDLEMFMPVIQDRSWREWLIEQLQRSTSRRVA